MTSGPDPVLQEAVREHLAERVRRTRRRPDHVAGPFAGGWRRVAVTGLVLAATAVGSVYAVQLGQRAERRPQPAATSSPSLPTQRDGLRGLITTASGTLTGAVEGTVSLTSRPDGGFVIQVDASRVTGTRTRHVELATSLRDVDCSAANDTDRSRVIDFGAADLSNPALLRRPPVDDNDLGDLSFMRVLVLTAKDGSSGDDDCTPSKMGVASLEWIRPAAFEALRAVDRGARAAARGTVSRMAGAPESYVVAPDDQLAAVAQRFELSTEELLYLNPRRSRGSDPRLYVDETLNLDTDRR